MTKTTKTLLHVGGGRLDLSSIRWAHGAGLDVVVTDADEAAPAARIARRFVTLAPSALDDLVQLALELNETGELLGAYAGDPAAAPALAAIGAATGTPAHAPDAVAATLAPDELAKHLAAADVPVDADAEGATRLDVDAILRDGTLLEGGILERIASREEVDELGIMQPTLRADERRAVYALIHRAACALGLGTGPVGARVVLGKEGPVIASLWPHFCERATTAFVSPTALGKSPVQAWLGTLGERGGPFDAMPSDRELESESASAGWMAIRAAEAGMFQGIEGTELALASRDLAGLCVVAGRGREIAAPLGNRTVVAYAYATGADPEEVETRLRSARRRLEVRVAQRSIA